VNAFEHLFDSGPVADASTPSSTEPPTGGGGQATSQQVTRVKEQAVRTYDDPVDVRKGPTDGLAGDGEEGPEQFLWRGRLWQVREVIAHWVETGAWWICKEAMVASSSRPGRASHREVWRVAAARGRAVSSVDDPGFGVFDLAFDWTEGVWRLAGSLD
jgi:hypothetical protein